MLSEISGWAGEGWGKKRHSTCTFFCSHTTRAGLYTFTPDERKQTPAPQAMTTGHPPLMSADAWSLEARCPRLPARFNFYWTEDCKLYANMTVDRFCCNIIKGLKRIILLYKTLGKPTCKSFWIFLILKHLDSGWCRNSLTCSLKISSRGVHIVPSHGYWFSKAC